MTKATALPKTFWCRECHRMTRIEDDVDEITGAPLCARCGGPFQCDECGEEIDRAGNCQRSGGCDYRAGA